MDQQRIDLDSAASVGHYIKPTVSPGLVLRAPTLGADYTPQVSIIVNDPNGVVPNGTPVTLLVDVNGDGPFAGSVAGVVQGDSAVFTLPTPTPGVQVAMEAQLTDATGVVWTSNVQSVMVQLQSAAGQGLVLQAPAVTSDPAPQVSVNVNDPNGVVPDGTAVTLLVDVNGDGTYALSVASVISGGVAVFSLPPLAPGSSYDMKAQLTDVTGVVWTSNVETVTVQPIQDDSAGDSTSPGLVLLAPTQTTDAAPQVSVVYDPNGVVPDGTAVTLLVDVNGDGTFAASVAGIVENGTAVFTSPLLTHGVGVAMKAQLTDATGAVWTSDVQVVTSVASGTLSTTPDDEPYGIEIITYNRPFLVASCADEPNFVPPGAPDNASSGSNSGTAASGSPSVMFAAAPGGNLIVPPPPFPLSVLDIPQLWYEDRIVRIGDQAAAKVTDKWRLQNPIHTEWGLTGYQSKGQYTNIGNTLMGQLGLDNNLTSIETKITAGLIASRHTGITFTTKSTMNWTITNVDAATKVNVGRVFWQARLVLTVSAANLSGAVETSTVTVGTADGHFDDERYINTQINP